MPTNSSIVEITDHALDRYEEIAVAGARRHVDDPRSEIRELVRSGTPTAAPSWLYKQGDAGRGTAPASTSTRRGGAEGVDRERIMGRHLPTLVRNSDAHVRCVPC